MADYKKVDKARKTLKLGESATIPEIKEAYRIFFLSGKSADDALAEIKETLHSEEIAHFVSFIEGSKRKICRYHYNRKDYFDEGEEGGE